MFKKINILLIINFIFFKIIKYLMLLYNFLKDVLNKLMPSSFNKFFSLLLNKDVNVYEYNSLSAITFRFVLIKTDSVGDKLLP
jgi:hypothetical protein